MIARKPSLTWWYKQREQELQEPHHNWMKQETSGGPSTPHSRCRLDGVRLFTWASLYTRYFMVLGSLIWLPPIWLMYGWWVGGAVWTPPSLCNYACSPSTVVFMAQSKDRQESMPWNAQGGSWWDGVMWQTGILLAVLLQPCGLCFLGSYPMLGKGLKAGWMIYLKPTALATHSMYPKPLKSE